MFYPMFFKPIYKTKVWGGDGIARCLNRSIPSDNVGESWEVCCENNGSSVIANGAFEGKGLDEVIKKYKAEILGTNCANIEKFPLLLKFIHADDNLSIQVHPDDAYASKNNEMGKTEAWYILDAEENAQIICGCKEGISLDEIKDAIKSGNIKDYLKYVDVKKGDFIYIPAGTVHAILKGVVLFEIQQNSDTTYRVYDWDRLDNGKLRELHIDKALDVINTSYNPKIAKTDIHESGCVNIIKSDYFIIDKVAVTDEYIDSTNGETFFIFTCVEGCGKLNYKDEEYEIETGCSFLLPSVFIQFRLTGKMNLLKQYCPKM